jgi:hypothetical protein
MKEAVLVAKSKTFALDIEAQKKVLAELLPLADRCWDYVDAMQQAGWDTVLPRLNFEASFGEGEVLLEYRRYVPELAKARIANPNIRFRLPEGMPFDSEFLKTLRDRRDDEFKGRFEPNEMPIWARKLAICLRRMELLRYSQRSEFERRFSVAEEEEQRRRIHEVARHATGASSPFSNELERPARFYRTVMEREFASFGFDHDATRSIGEYVVLSKPLVAGWDLCLTPEPLAWYPGRKDGEVRIVLSLQAARHRRPMRRAKWEQVLAIEYVELVPYFDFCYRRFASLDELETLIMARAFLLSLTIKEIEPRLLAVLGTSP